MTTEVNHRRRFFRTKYNSERVLKLFASPIRNEVEMEQLTNHHFSVVDESVQPESVGLWLRMDKSSKF